MTKKKQNTKAEPHKLIYAEEFIGFDGLQLAVINARKKIVGTDNDPAEVGVFGTLKIIHDPSDGNLNISIKTQA